MQSVKEALYQINVDQVIVPGSCTKYVQTPDVSWMKPYKALVSEQYDEWMASGWLVVFKNVQRQETCDRLRETPL